MRAHQVGSYGPGVTANTDRREYEIRVRGHLGSRWAAWFDGFNVTDDDGGVTVIRGAVADQAALHGVLQKLRDLGIPLVSLTDIGPAPVRRHRKEVTDMSTTALRRTALFAGLLYIATFVFSIPAKFGLWEDVLNTPDFIVGGGSDSGVVLGALFEVITALAGVGTAVVLFSVARRHHERLALGFVTTRVVEAAMIFVGVLGVLSVYTLRNESAGAETESLLTTGRALIAVHDWSFLLGPGLMAVCNALCLATLMYRTRLVPRIIPTIGLIGAPILLASDLATLFGAYDQVSAPAALFALPIAAWEFSLGVWMTVKGFSPAESAVSTEPSATTTLAVAIH